MGSYLTRTGDGFLAMQRSCTKNPTIKYNTTSNFPVASDPSGSDVNMYFYGVNLEFPKTTTAIRYIRMENAQLIVSGTLTTNKNVTLYQNTKKELKPENAYVNISGTWDVKGGLNSNKYEFNPRGVVTSKKGKIKFFTSTYMLNQTVTGKIDNLTFEVTATQEFTAYE